MLLAMLPSAIAHGAPTLTVGMKILIGKHSCSLGFFGFNANSDRLAVTAGHCADGVDQAVYAANGTRIGTVVSHMGESDSRDPVRPRGYTLIGISNRFAISRGFTGVADAHTGDRVWKRGARSGATSGVITDTYYTDGEKSHLETLIGNIVILPGDSGGPWYTDGPTLVGISASGNYDRGASSDTGSQAQPVGSVIRLIRDGSPRWGTNFKVWVNT
ncbi:hypothetical protein EB74_16490 [Mycobacterium sp. SWH-M5]|uniref:trypsin-like peptidase domain-containing protein n=1 Tax=Mycolicibacterium goodii TaxID=134601 RepID=UPI00096156E7|nr:trypsin-like peptidase domain-containing protein [Mycolicibacterium goodii]MBU8817550.1 trypsin-like peptidase domain-containing protein [Mycolicibacterium goodii]OKH62497.1 hypothetical protein EB74_16490 [Mycobacterium sp. SWH-M5]